MPDIGLRETYVLGVDSWTVDPDAFGMRAQVSASGQAVSTFTTDKMTFATDNFTWEKVAHV